jgi:DNA helicase-2/ATP-dependent DNA helicase PcrA
VTLLNAVDGCIPSDLSAGATAEPDEEWRLHKLAMTSARVHLSLVAPHRASRLRGRIMA